MILCYEGGGSTMMYRTVSYVRGYGQTSSNILSQWLTEEYSILQIVSGGVGDGSI